jgi:hypothetical protein
VDVATNVSQRRCQGALLIPIKIKKWECKGKLGEKDGISEISKFGKLYPTHTKITKSTS